MSEKHDNPNEPVPPQLVWIRLRTKDDGELEVDNGSPGFYAESGYDWSPPDWPLERRQWVAYVPESMMDDALRFDEQSLFEEYSRLLCENGKLLQERSVARAERDKAQSNYEWMVKRAADEKLDGYRELGERAAKAEDERDEWKARALAAEDKSLRFDLDQAGIERRDAEAEELVTLRAKVAELERVLDVTESFHAVAVRERDYERRMVNRLAAEMRKQRPSIGVVYDRGAWELADKLGRQGRDD